MSVLVTGGTGSLGYHLLSILTRTKGQLYSFGTEPAFQHRFLDHVEYLIGDLLNLDEVLALLEKTRPTEIYHVASQSNVGVSHKKPLETLSTNVLATQNLLEAVRRVSPLTKVLLLSSSDVYGIGNGHLDTLRVESDPYKPMTPFASSKACMEILGLQYARAWGIHVVIARPFNYTGPGHSRRFVMPNIADQLVRIVHYGREPVLYTGNIDVSRDFVDFRDLARSLVLLMNTAVSNSVYNICTGKVRTVREMIDMMIEIAGVDVDMVRDPSRERTIDVPLLMGSPEKIMRDTGWRPMIDIEDTLFDTYKEMEIRVKNEYETGKNFLD
jgi:GDP-4-dehydro-6-deoxy-D-mannose reductase